MSTPFDRRKEPIPVTVVTYPVVGTTSDGTAVLTMEPADHIHESGVLCAACEARYDVRALLFDLLEGVRQGRRPEFSRVVVDASALSDASSVIARLDGTAPAAAYRDLAVARNFRLVA
jgi:hypothetical protein